jgi:hypothetical protein
LFRVIWEDRLAAGLPDFPVDAIFDGLDSFSPGCVQLRGDDGIQPVLMVSVKVDCRAHNLGQEMQPGV